MAIQRYLPQSVKDQPGLTFHGWILFSLRSPCRLGGAAHRKFETVDLFSLFGRIRWSWLLSVFPVGRPASGIREKMDPVLLVNKIKAGARRRCGKRRTPAGSVELPRVGCEYLVGNPDLQGEFDGVSNP